MKVGDLVRYKNQRNARGEVYLIMRTQVEGPCGRLLRVWIYPDPEEGYVHTDDLNYYYAHYFEVVNKSR